MNAPVLMIKPAVIVFMLLYFLATPCLGKSKAEEKELQFNANEAESMLYLFNQTTVSGGDVELIAQLGAKLKQGLKDARKLDDPKKTVILKLNDQEGRYCLFIIRRSTFSAKYAELVLGMKQKLEKLFLPMPVCLPKNSKTN